MCAWSAPERPAAYAENALISAILDGVYPPGTSLPGERDLAAALGVTRPTLREALQRLERDGWLTIRQGKSTLVNDFWRDGGLNVLNALARHEPSLPADFVPHLLQVRLLLAPAYTRGAIERDPRAVIGLLAGGTILADTPDAYAAFDWDLHRTLTHHSGNPVFALILNGFAALYHDMACLYFATAPARTISARFYRDLLIAARASDGQAAEEITRAVMLESIRMWQTAAG